MTCWRTAVSSYPDGTPQRADAHGTILTGCLRNIWKWGGSEVGKKWLLRACSSMLWTKAAVLLLVGCSTEPHNNHLWAVSHFKIGFDFNLCCVCCEEGRMAAVSEHFEMHSHSHSLRRFCFVETQDWCGAGTRSGMQVQSNLVRLQSHHRSRRK